MLKTIRSWWSRSKCLFHVQLRFHKFLFDCTTELTGHDLISEHSFMLVRWNDHVIYKDPVYQTGLFDARATIKALVKDVGRVEKVWNYEGTWHAEVVLYWNKM